MVIIGLCGFQGSGKDTVADILVKEHGFIKFSFGSTLKDIISILFGWNRNMVEGSTPESRIEREKVDQWWSDKLEIDNFTPRKALQLIGTDLFRNNFNNNIWINIVEKKIIENINKNIVITDCRFPNEINMIKKYDAELIYIKRNEPLWFLDYKNGNDDIDEIKNIHPSETSWIRINNDYIIDNSNITIEELKNEINKFLFI